MEKDSSPKVFGNFIVDPKTGSIMMVVRKETLSKLKTLIKKLDVPKKMVQIEVLLVEKRLRDRKQTGINLLKIGKRVAKDINETSTVFDAEHCGPKKGILEFILRQKATHYWPAFDLILNFLMAQEDIRINSNPSILAVNQTPAKISIVEELSINNGAVPISTGQTFAYEKSYSRAQYGVTIVITPTVHLPDVDDEEDVKGSITLQTNVNFDTTQETADDRPPVTRRQIENEVCVADGETVILGGLRKKTGEDVREKIPFLGDIPGIGKLFGTTKMANSTTEMLIFITPKIIKDPVDDLRRERTLLLQKRPGDIPAFMERLEASRNQERRKLFENSFKLLFDKL
jgi:general secretion pathway protein D